jgi:hypothetical protein
MMAHPLILAIAAVGLALAPAMGSAAVGWISSGLIGALIVERTAAGLRAAWRFRTPVPLVFPVLHLARDAAWVAAIVTWCARRVLRLHSVPAHSMRTRAAAVSTDDRSTLALGRVLCLVPAYNEAPNLAAVVDELRAQAPHCDILIVDDGSTDATGDLVRSLGVRWLRFPERLGVGNAIRAGLRLASRLGYEAAVRIDGDGQHRAADIDRLLAPLRAGEADVVIGTRFPGSAGGPGVSRLPQRLLATTLSAVTGRAVTDPTSGFCAIGRRAMRLLAEHHPGGYGEPELRLFLSRNGLSVIETPVLPRERLRGRTSLTPRRVATAAAHVALAMLIVPLRQRIGGAHGG